MKKKQCLSLSNKKALEQLATEYDNFVNNKKPTTKQKAEKLGLTIIIGGK